MSYIKRYLKRYYSIAFTVIGFPILWHWFSLPSEERDSKYGPYNP
jgi:hypothetical protein